MKVMFHTKIQICLLQFLSKIKSIFHVFMIIRKQWKQTFHQDIWPKMNYLNLKKTIQTIRSLSNIQLKIKKIEMIIRNLFSWIHMKKMSKAVMILSIAVNSSNSIMTKVTHKMKSKIFNNHPKKNKFSVKYQENWTMCNSNLILRSSKLKDQNYLKFRK